MINRFTRSAILFIMVSFISASSWAKEAGAAIDISTTKDDSLWHYFPWIWVTGGAIFILLLLAVIRTHQKKYS